MTDDLRRRAAETIRASITGGVVTFVSRIRFRLMPESIAAAQELRDKGSRHVYPDHPASPEHIEVWPLNDGTAILERTITCTLAEYPNMLLAHPMMDRGFVDSLSASHGMATSVLLAEFKETDPLEDSK